ncbi:MAG: SURF1 family protein [Paracoccaceae bacterium]
MKRYVFALVMGFAGCAILVSLGIWQVQRLEVKLAAIAEIDSRIASPARPLPITPYHGRDKYLAVHANGTLLDQALRIYTSRKGEGAGYRIVQVFEVGGRRIMLDRGFLPIEAHSDIAGPVAVEVTGNLHWPDETSSWTPAPDIAGNRWFARDVPSMAAALGTEPVLIIARTLSPDSFTARPVPVSSADVTNDHLEYAITWFSLALVWAGMTVYLLWRIKRRTA